MLERLVDAWSRRFANASELPEGLQYLEVPGRRGPEQALFMNVQDFSEPCESAHWQGVL